MTLRARLASLVPFLTLPSVIGCVILLVILYSYSDAIMNLLPDMYLQDRVGISVASPTIHTRERLLNDRFEQVSWLDKRLKATLPRERPQASEDAAHTAGKASEQHDLPPAPAANALQRSTDDRLQYGQGNQTHEFEVVNGYRDILRAERARAMLDDRHDMDGSTLHLLSFDTTVLPRRSAQGFAAIEVTISRNENDLLKDIVNRENAITRLNDYKSQDLFDIYIGWLEKIRVLQQNYLDQLTHLLDTEDFAIHQDISVRLSDFEPTLTSIACRELLRLQFIGTAQPTEGMWHDVCAQVSKLGTTAHDLYDLKKPKPMPGQVSKEQDEQDFAHLAVNAIATYLDDVSGRLKASRRNPVGTVESITGLREWSDAIKQISDRKDKPDPLVATVMPLIVNADRDVQIALQLLANTGSACNSSQSLGKKEDFHTLVSPLLLSILAKTLPHFKPPAKIEAVCVAEEKPNERMRLLYALIQKLASLKKLPEPLSAPSGEIASVGDHLRILDEIGMSVADVHTLDTSCMASLYIEETMLLASAGQPRNHGASLEEFFNIRVDHLQSSCKVVIEPKVTSIRHLSKGGEQQVFSDEKKCPSDTQGELSKDDRCLLDKLEKLLEGIGYSERKAKTETYPFSYSLSPRLNENFAKQTQQRTSANGAISGQQVGLDQLTSADVQGIEATAVGFSRLSSQQEKKKGFHGARFGWIVASQPGNGLNWSLPLAQMQLGAVVAMPSWWRSALLQVCTRYVKPDSVAKIMEPELWTSSEHCRVEAIRLPGTSADLSRQLGMDVLTTPYMEEWEQMPTVYAADPARPAKLLIKGERLWRSTVVTLGGQKADAIEVLPDMVGILATFECVEVPTIGTSAPGTLLDSALTQPPRPDGHTAPPPASAPNKKKSVAATASGTPQSSPPLQSEQSGAAAPIPPGNRPDYDGSYRAWRVPVTVWTSEGHTISHNAEVRLVARHQNNETCHPANVAATAPPKQEADHDLLAVLH